MELAFVAIHDLSSDANFVFVSGSAELMLGYKTEDIRGRSYFNYMHPDDSTTVREVWSLVKNPVLDELTKFEK
ncbi:hypothetical protein PG999_010035 [Apiospora kogelbergensis]|uniref:PAS domain-containing protein n=1 Tax=Apiospora kogelbergensis TaxID=1337665 RepID=A0AAW0QNA1_9PEZI